VFPHHFRLTYLARPERKLSHVVVAVALLIAALALCALPAAAQASTGSCPATTVSEPFSQWGDANSYALVAQGDFEGSLSDWTLGAGTSAVAGSEPYGTTGTVGKQSLALAAGSSAQSPFTCVTASDPTFRFFARGTAALSVLTVSVVYKTLLGTLAVPLGVVTPGSTWQPTAPMLTASAIVGLLSGGTAELALRFTEVTGSSQIDDIFIDPRMR
jgi:hypothetical protein